MGRQRGTPLIGRLDTRKEHYLPRFFLRRFVDDKGTLSVISRADEGGRPCLRPNMRVENVASVNGLYETAYPGDRNGTYYFPNYIEKSLSSMETALGPGAWLDPRHRSGDEAKRSPERRRTIQDHGFHLLFRSPHRLAKPPVRGFREAHGRQVGGFP